MMDASKLAATAGITEEEAEAIVLLGTIIVEATADVLSDFLDPDTTVEASTAVTISVLVALSQAALDYDFSYVVAETGDIL